jgi:Protein of unknown function (DUF3515)
VTRPLVAAMLALAGLAGCSSPSAVQAAPRAGSAACTSVLARLPETVADQSRGPDPAAGAAAWGDPAIVLRCGLPPTTPTTAECVSVNGFDWVFEQSDQAFVFVSYGRNPAVEVTVPASYGRDLASAATVDLITALNPLPVERTCD